MLYHVWRKTNQEIRAANSGQKGRNTNHKIQWVAIKRCRGLIAG